MSEIRKLIKKIEKEIEERETILGIEETHKGHWTYDDILKTKLKGIKEGLEALKKDLIKKQPCPNKYPYLAAVYEEVIEDINEILGDEK